MVSKITDKTISKPRFLPGDLNHKDNMARMMRVNHAGEYGAKRIYQGQIAVLGNGDKGDILRHMAEQEQVHLEYFASQLIKRRVRPTALMPIWHVAGFALGAATALISDKAAMACTVAVEEVIDEHYSEQYKHLDELKTEEELKDQIETFRLEEIEHRDIGYENGAEQAIAYPLIVAMVKKGSKFAIWLASRI